MFNGKYKSISTVIENILRDTDYYNEINKEDITEWAVRAMELIGAPLVYTQTITTVGVVNYRAELPTNLREIIAVRDHLSRHTLIEATDSYLMSLYDQSINNETEFDDPVIREDNLLMGEKPARMFSYQIKNGYLFLNVKEGAIDIAYSYYPLDSNGCLLIPDVDRYMIAVESYIVYKIDSKLYRRGIISKTIKDESEQNWLFYVNSAFTKIVTPNYDEAEALKNQIVKIRTDSNAHDYGFESLGVPTVKKF